MKRFRFGSVGPVLALGLLTLSCKQSPPGGSDPVQGKGKGAPAAPRPVAIAKAERRPMERVVKVTGALAALERSTLAAKVPGRVVELGVDIGSPVQQGQIIARVDPRDYELKLRQTEAAVVQARAALGLPPTGTNEIANIEEVSLVRVAAAVLQEATRQHERVRLLVEQNVASTAEYDKVLADFNVASNRLLSAKEEARISQAALSQRRAENEIARQQLDDTQLRAPYTGVVEARLTSLGEYLNASAPVATLVRTDVLRLRLEVPEREATRIELNAPIRFRVDGDTNIHQVRLKRMSPSISELNRMLIVEAEVAGGAVLRPGAFVRADIVVDANEPGVAVPREALVVFAGLEKVVTLRENKAVERTVITGRQGPGWIEIVSGVQPGDPVVLKPGNLRTGDPVIVGDAAAAAAAETSGVGRPAGGGPGKAKSGR